MAASSQLFFAVLLFLSCAQCSLSVSSSAAPEKTGVLKRSGSWGWTSHRPYWRGRNERRSISRTTSLGDWYAWIMGLGSKNETGSLPRPEAQTPDEACRTGSSPKPAAGSEAQAWLDAHNKYRAEYGAPAVRWSETLAETAKRLTDRCVFEHSGGQYGENIAAGYPTLESVVDDWVNGKDEKDSYVPSHPTYSHFTQVVWVATTHIGCTKTECPQLSKFWACNYNPPGNVIGEFAQNVKARAGGQPS